MDHSSRGSFRDGVRTFWLRVGAYLFWGAMTTLVNVAAFWLFRSAFDAPLVAANACAWTLAVLFAYVTNRAFVFPSRAASLPAKAGELARFFLSRLFSGALDMGLMFVGARLLSVDELATKIAVNAVVVVVNYVTSSLVVFGRARTDGTGTGTERAYEEAE